MKDWQVFGLIILTILFISGTFSITQLITPVENAPGQLTDTQYECYKLMGETRNENPSAHWAVTDCRICPAVVKTVPTRCYLGRGDACPAGAQCNYPPLDANGATCLGSTCSINFWDPSYRGCHQGGANATGSFLVMLEQSEIGTSQQTYVENLYNTTCFPTTTNPPPTDGGLPSSFPFTAIAIFLIIGGLLLAYVGRKK